MLLTQYSRRWQFLMLIAVLTILFSSPLVAQSELEQKNDFLKSSSAALEARWSRLSGFQKLAAYVKRVTPFYSWINLCTAIDVDDKSFLMGNCLEDESSAMFHKSMDNYRHEHSATIERLWATSELDAMTYAGTSLGQDTFEISRKNAISIAQLIALGVVGFIFLRRFDFSLFGWASAIGWKGMKRAFYVSVLVWLLGGAALQIFGRISGFSIALMNLQTFVLLIFGGLSIVLGTILGGRWLWIRNERY